MLLVKANFSLFSYSVFLVLEIKNFETGMKYIGTQSFFPKWNLRLIKKIQFPSEQMFFFASFLVATLSCLDSISR